MAKKRKKKRKKAKANASQQLHRQRPEQLLERGQEFLRNEKPRGAIEMFKTVAKIQGLTPELRRLLCRAYALRSEHLRAKGLEMEARATAAQALGHMGDIAGLQEADMVVLAAACSGPDLFDVYNRYVHAHGRCPETEAHLAWNLFRDGDWELAERLDSAIPIRREASLVREAVVAMDAGDWEEALGKLRPLPRKSAFAAVRLFCRGMVSFYRKDDADALKAFSLIPSGFPLAGVVAQMKNALAAAEGSEERIQAAAHLPMLAGMAMHSDAAQTLIDALRAGNHRRTAKACVKFASGLLPEDPATAVSLTLQALLGMVRTREGGVYEYMEIVRKLLPKDQADGLLAGCLFFVDEDPFYDAGRYITNHLERMFPDPEEAKIAKALILISRLQAVVNDPYELYYTLSSDIGLEQYAGTFGISSDDPEKMAIEIMAEAIRLDPLHRASYGLLVQLPRRSRAARKQVADLLTQMLSRFPDDPFPCLELASLYYESNAFRKAEAILEEAMKRAPHDSRVIDKHALSLVISSEQNLRRQNFHLVARDLDRAERVGSKKVAPHMVEKRLLLHLMDPKQALPLKQQRGQLSLFRSGLTFGRYLEDEMAKLGVVESLRVLALLVQDVEGREFPKKPSLQKYLNKQLSRALKATSALSSSEAVALLQPLHRDFRSLYPSWELAPFLVKRSKKLLRQIDDSEIVPVYHRILVPELYDSIGKDLKRRLRRARGKTAVVLEFHQAVLNHLTGCTWDGDEFLHILDELEDERTREELRALSRRLSRQVSEPLKRALETFDFEVLDRYGEIMSPFSEERDDFLDDFTVDDWDDRLGEGSDDLDLEAVFEGFAMALEARLTELEGEGVGAVCRMPEELIDDFSLRNKPDSYIQFFRDSLAEPFPGLHRLLNKLADFIDRWDGRSLLSREAHCLLYGEVRQGRWSFAPERR